MLPLVLSQLRHVVKVMVAEEENGSEEEGSALQVVSNLLLPLTG